MARTNIIKVVSTLICLPVSFSKQFFVASPKFRHNTTRNDIVDLCSVLKEDNVFTCREKWQNGASGRAFDGVSDLRSAIHVTADTLQMTKGVRWLVLDDSEVVQRSLGKKSFNIPKPFLGFFSYQEDVTLFAEQDAATASDITGTTQRRRLMGADASPALTHRRGLLQQSTDQRNSIVVQHAATPALGAMSTFAGGCTSQCRSESSYYYASAGDKVQVYIVDGIVMEHAQFKDMRSGESRLSKDRFLSESARDSDPDCAGDHATHVAAIAAGYEFGTSKAPEVVSVAVQPGCEQSGMASDLVEGLDWILKRQQAFGKKKDRPAAVVSMSLILQDGSDIAELVKDKIGELLDEDVVVVAAAGNFHEDACDYVPANIPDVVTVAGASVFPGGGRAIAWSWSNYGECVDLFTPAVDIESANPDCFECTAIYSGTSQATPFVTGLVAQYLAVNPNAGPREVKKELVKASTDQFLETFKYPYEGTPKAFAQSLINLQVRQVKFSSPG